MIPQAARARATLALALALAAAAIALMAAIVVWQIASARTDERLCGVLYSLVARSGATVGQKGSPGYAYYAKHPAELAAARRQNQEFLSDLPCKPKETP